VIAGKEEGYDMSKDSKKEQAKRRPLLERVARMYYIIGMNQQDIANQLDIGRSSVARFLNEAREEGIVQIYVSSDSEKERRSDLENRLVAAFRLRDAVVAKRNPVFSFRVTVSKYLNTILPFQGSVGLSGGRTILSVGEYMHLCDPRPDLNLIQLTGSGGDIPSASVLQSWSDALKAKPFYLSAPAIVKDRDTREVFLQDEEIKKTYAHIKRVELSLFGIGNVDANSTILQANLISNLTTEILGAKSIGDVNFHFYNSNGKFSIPEISDCVVGASPADLMRIPTRIGMAFGEHKVNTIRAALAGKIANILLTDDTTAELLLQPFTR